MITETFLQFIQTILLDVIMNEKKTLNQDKNVSFFFCSKVVSLQLVDYDIRGLEISSLTFT